MRRTKKKGYFILAVMLMVTAISTSFAYIFMDEASRFVEKDTNHGQKVTLVVELDDFSDQILIPQNALKTNEFETKTLNINGRVRLDNTVEGDNLEVDLFYEVLSNGVSIADKVKINPTIEEANLTHQDTEFSLQVSLLEGETLQDNQVITVKVTAQAKENNPEA